MIKINLLQGDCLNSMKELPDNSIDSIVTDPPYGLSFMGKKWDYDVPSVEIWKECLRVLKPGGHLLSFGGTRTYHRMTVNIEDAGFEIRDQIMWIYGSGFPKSTDVSKRIDKEAGESREIIGYGKLNPKDKKSYEPKASNDIFDRNNGMQKLAITAPATESAKQWEGWGTALKPANEPICVARKPLEKGLTIAENVLKYGTGAINVDASRIESTDVFGGGAKPTNAKGSIFESGHGSYEGDGFKPSTQGRWPANIIFDEQAAEMLDASTGKVRGLKDPNKKQKKLDQVMFNVGEGHKGQKYADQTGLLEYFSPSRFFYVAKASKRERNAGLEGMPEKVVSVWGGDEDDLTEGKKSTIPRQNHHPTVKPIKLMEYLIKLVTPPNGTVLDPFMGSGSTGVAANQLGFKFVGCEMNEEYFEIAKNRIENHQPKQINYFLKTEDEE